MGGVSKIIMKLMLAYMKEPTDNRYSCYNTGSVEMEVGEFLYGLVRMIKPTAILETGTYKGVSTALMAMALQENGAGKITTLEFIPELWKEANSMFDIYHLRDWIDSVIVDAKDYPVTPNKYDFIFLDTEPQTRFAEFLKFWSSLKPGGFIAIHDLNPHMGQTGQTVNDMLDWPFGTMPDEMKKILKNECQNFHFETPRGLYLGQN